MSKYKPLADFLAAHAPDTWKATFADIEAALGSALPKTAREKDAWWTDPDKLQAQAWIGAGWAVDALDLAGGSVTFKRTPPPKSADDVIAEAASAYEKVKVVEAAKKAGIVAGIVGAVGVVVGVVVGLVGRKK